MGMNRGGGGGGACPPGQGGGGSMGSRIAQMMQQRGKPQGDPRSMPTSGMRPPDQNGVRTAFNHGGGSPPRGGGNPMQRQMMQAQAMRRPPNPTGHRGRGMAPRGMMR